MAMMHGLQRPRFLAAPCSGVDRAARHSQRVKRASARGDHFPQQNRDPNSRYPQSPSDTTSEPTPPQPGGYSHINVEPPKRVVANNIGLKVGAAYALTFLINYGSNLGWFFGNTNAQISHMHPTPLTPADWAFGIWGIIFTCQAIAIWALAKAPDSPENQTKLGALQAIGPFWIAGWFCQSVWQVLFCANTPLSLLASAAVLLGATRSFHAALDRTQDVLERSAGMLTVRMSFLLSAASAVNAAWVSTATAVGCAIAIKTNTKMNPLPWCVVMAALVALNGMRVTRTKKNFMYVFTLVWSFAGIYAAQAAKSAGMKATLSLALASNVACAAYILATNGKGAEGTDSSGKATPLAA